MKNYEPLFCWTVSTIYWGLNILVASDSILVNHPTAYSGGFSRGRALAVGIGFGDISILRTILLVTFQFWQHFTSGCISVLVTFQFGDISVLVTFLFWGHFYCHLSIVYILLSNWANVLWPKDTSAHFFWFPGACCQVIILID